MKDARISGYFDTKYMTVLRIEQILHNFEDQKIANFLYLGQVDFRMTLVILSMTLITVFRSYHFNDRLLVNAESTFSNPE